MYLQPVAGHPDVPERLLLRGQDDLWYVWTGAGAGAIPEEIAEVTARWLLIGERVLAFPADGPWFHVDDLPLAAAPHRSRSA